MVIIYGRTGASFITGGYEPTRDQRRHWGRAGWTLTYFFPLLAPGARRDLLYLYWRWRALPNFRSPGATTRASDYDLWNAWRALVKPSSYVDRVRLDAYGRSGIRVGASSEGGALQVISQERAGLTAEMRRRGLWS